MSLMTDTGPGKPQAWVGGAAVGRRAGAGYVRWYEQDQDMVRRMTGPSPEWKEEPWVWVVHLHGRLLGMWVTEQRARRYVSAIGRGEVSRVHVGEASRQYVAQERHPDGLRGSQYRCLDAMRRKLATGEQGRILRERAAARRRGWCLRWAPREACWEAVWRVDRLPGRRGQITRLLGTADRELARERLGKLMPPALQGQHEGRNVFFVDGWDD